MGFSILCFGSVRKLEDVIIEEINSKLRVSWVMPLESASCRYQVELDSTIVGNNLVGNYYEFPLGTLVACQVHEITVNVMNVNGKKGDSQSVQYEKR